MYVTDRGMPNPWEKLPWFLDIEVQMMGKLRVARAASGADNAPAARDSAASTAGPAAEAEGSGPAGGGGESGTGAVGGAGTTAGASKYGLRGILGRMKFW